MTDIVNKDTDREASAMELLPCPFCGAEAHPMTLTDADWSDKKFVSYRCGTCRAQAGDVFGTADPSEWQEAREHWNRRAPVAQGALADALRTVVLANGALRDYEIEEARLALAAYDSANSPIAGSGPAHFDHPSRVWDHTCPAGNPDASPQPDAEQGSREAKAMYSAEPLREAFEFYVRANWTDVTSRAFMRDGGDGYVDSVTHECWRTWEAAHDPSWSAARAPAKAQEDAPPGSWIPIGRVVDGKVRWTGAQIPPADGTKLFGMPPTSPAPFEQAERDDDLMPPHTIEASVRAMPIDAAVRRVIRDAIEYGIELGKAAPATTGQAVADGWQVVPKVPTREMLNAMIDVDAFKLGDISPLGFRCSPQQLFEKCYRAMLAAAPLAVLDEAARDAGQEAIRVEVDQATFDHTVDSIANNAWNDAIEEAKQAIRDRHATWPGPLDADEIIGDLQSLKRTQAGG